MKFKAFKYLRSTHSTSSPTREKKRKERRKNPCGNEQPCSKKTDNRINYLKSMALETFDIRTSKFLNSTVAQFIFEVNHMQKKPVRMHSENQLV